MDSTILVQTAWSGLVNGTSYALFATGLTLIFGIMFVMNFAHGEIFMLGAIIVHVLMKFLGLNFFAAAVIAIAAVAAFGVLLNRTTVNPLLGSMWGGILATIAVSMILLNGITAIMGPTAHLIETPFEGIVQLGEIRISKESMGLFGVGSATIIVVLIFIQKSKIGKDMRATIQNPVGAGLCGINTIRVYDYTLVLASGLAALGGILMAVLTIADPFMGGPMLIKGFAIVIAAGMGNLMGAIILGLIIGVAESVFSLLVMPYFRETFIYGVMVLILLLRPEGLFNRSRG